MAFRKPTPKIILKVLTLRARGEPKSRIAKETGLSRKTVARYIAIALGEGWTPLGRPPARELALRVAAKLRPGPRRTEEILRPIKEEIRSCLESGKPLTMIHKELLSRGVNVGLQLAAPVHREQPVSRW